MCVAQTGEGDEANTRTGLADERLTSIKIFEVLLSWSSLIGSVMLGEEVLRAAAVVWTTAFRS